MKSRLLSSVPQGFIIYHIYDFVVRKQAEQFEQGQINIQDFSLIRCQQRLQTLPYWYEQWFFPSKYFSIYLALSFRMTAPDFFTPFCINFILGEFLAFRRQLE